MTSWRGGHGGRRPIAVLGPDAANGACQGRCGNAGNSFCDKGTVQAAKTSIGFEALDNGFAAVDDVDRLQAICDSLGPAQIDALLRKWLRILPHPFSDDDVQAGPPATAMNCRSCRPSSR